MNRIGHLGVAVLTAGVAHHYLSSGTDTIIENAFLIVFAILGAKTPDIDLQLKHILPRDTHFTTYHRQITHSPILWSLLFIFGIFGEMSFNSLFDLIKNISNIQYSNIDTETVFNKYILFFAVGGISHLIADFLTGTIPLFLWGSVRNKFRIGIRYVPIKVFFVQMGEFMAIPFIILGSYIVFF